MHMHNMFMRGPPPHGMSPGGHGMWPHMMLKPPGLWPHMMWPKPHEMGPHGPHKPGHRMSPPMFNGIHPPMFHRMPHEKHRKHHHMKHGRRSSSSSSSSSSESEDEFLGNGQHGKDNPKNGIPNLGHPFEKPPPEMFQMLHKPHGRPHHLPHGPHAGRPHHFPHGPHAGRPHHFPHGPHEMMDYMPEPGEVLPHTKPPHHGPFHMMHKKHKIGPHRMRPRKFHKGHQMGHKPRRMGDHKSGPWMFDEMGFHKMHHHKMHKKHHHMKHRGRSSSRSSSSSSDSENEAPAGVYEIQSGDK